MQNPLYRLADALQMAGPQSPETRDKSPNGTKITRDIDIIPAPENIADEYELFRETPFVAASFYQFQSDVLAPGYRIDAEAEKTEDWFNGGEAAPSDAPEGGFLSEAGVVAGERGQDFGQILEQSVIQYLGAGNILAEKVKQDPSASDPTYTGFMHIRPGSVQLVTEDNRPILVSPDAEDPAYTTKRGEAAAYLQYSPDSIFGQLNRYEDRDVVKLSTNDVIKVARNPVPGQIWGQTAIHPAADLIRGLKQILKDNEQAIQSKAYGIWSVAFGREMYEYPNGDVEIVEWSPEDQTQFIEDTIGRELDPGDILGHDGQIDFEKFEGEVADELLDVIETYIKLIVSALPTPLYQVGFESDINQFVTQAQEPRYEKAVRDMREVLISAFEPALEEIAEQQGLSTEGFALHIEPEKDESPVRELDTDDMERLELFSTALKNIYGSGGVPTYLDEETVVETILQLPEGAIDESDVEAIPQLNEQDPNVMEQFEQQNQSEQQPATDGGQDDANG